jgi:hypothetical protein
MTTQTALFTLLLNNDSTESFAVDAPQLKLLEDSDLDLVGGGQLLTPY